MKKIKKFRDGQNTPRSTPHQLGVEMQQAVAVGNLVRIIDRDRDYTAFPDQALAMKLDKYEINQRVPTGAVGEVVAVAKHLHDDTRTLCGVLFAGKHYLFNLEGLQVIVEMPKLKQDWSFPSPSEWHYNKSKEVLQGLGYTFSEWDRYDAMFPFIASYEGAYTVTQDDTEETHHFENIMDFLIFHLDGQEELKALIATKKAELAELEAKLAA